MIQTWWIGGGASGASAPAELGLSSRPSATRPRQSPATTPVSFQCLSTKRLLVTIMSPLIPERHATRALYRTDTGVLLRNRYEAVKVRRSAASVDRVRALSGGRYAPGQVTLVQTKNETGGRARRRAAPRTRALARRREPRVDRQLRGCPRSRPTKPRVRSPKNLRSGVLGVITAVITNAPPDPSRS